MSHMQKTDAVDYLRTVAIARIVLDNVPNLQSSWVTMGMKVGQTALRVRLQRLRLADDRGERRLGGEHDAPHDDRGDGAADPRRRLHAARGAGRTTRSSRRAVAGGVIGAGAERPRMR